MKRFFSVFLVLGLSVLSIVPVRSLTAQDETEQKVGVSEFEPRIWTDQSGRKAKATFVEMQDRNVVLKGENGKTFSIEVSKLGTADKTYLRNKRIEFLEKITTDKTASEEKLAASGVIVSLYDKNAAPIPAGFRKMFRSPFTAARSVAYNANGGRVLVWRHSNEALLWDHRTGRKLEVYKGNTSGAEVVAFRDDGRINIAGAGNNVVVRDTLTGEVLATLEGHTDLVTPVALSPDGKWGLSGAADKTAILWDIESGKMLHRLEEHQGRVLSVAFHPVGMHVLTGGDDGVAIQWDIRTGKAVKRFSKVGGPVNSVSYNQDGIVAMLIAPGTAILWDTFVEKDPQRAGSSGYVRKNPILGELQSLTMVSPGESPIRDGLFESVSFSKDNTRFLLVSKPGNVFFGSLKQQAWVRTIERLESGINRAAFNHDATEYLTVSFNDNAIFWDNEMGKKIAEFLGYDYCVSPIRMTRDGNRILTSGGWADPTIAVWETQTGKLLKRLDGHRAAVRRLEVSPDGKRILSVSSEEFNDQRHGFGLPKEAQKNDPKMHVIFWDISTGKPLIEVRDAVGVAFAPNGRQLITARTKNDGDNEGNLISFWDPHTGRCQREEEMKTGNLGHDFLFHPDNNRVLSKRGKAAFNWVARSGKESGIYRALQYDFWSAVFSKDGKFLLTGTNEGKAVLWNLLRDEPAAEFGGHGSAVLSVALSPDGKKVLTGSTDKTAILWNAEDGSQIRKLQAGEGSIVGVDFTQDGKLAMVASEDGTVAFHEIE